MAFNLKNIFIYKDKILTIVFFIAVFIYLLSPVRDVDFPWHLKSGEYIVQHKEIPVDDPFSHTHEGFIGDREKFQLSQYWLAQVIFYGLYSAGGLTPIVIFRTLWFLMFFVLLWTMLRKRGLYYAIIFSVLSVITLDSHRSDNPQIFSTVFALFLIFFLEKFRKDPASPRALFYIPPLMLLWANLHGGFIFGFAIILIYISTETIKYFFCRSGNLRLGQALNTKQLSSLAIFGFASIFISYMNPNGFKALEIAFEPYIRPAEFKGFYSGVRGYMDPIQATADPYGSKLSDFSFWILLGYISIVILFKITRKKMLELTSFSLIVFSAIASLSAVRYITFFVAVAIPLMVDYRFLKENISLKKLNDSKLIFALFLFSFLLLIGWQLKLKDKANLFEFKETRIYPVRAANFLIENHIEGNMFNSYNKGGYLLWKLYPKYKVFFDTRVLNIETITDGISISNASNYMGEPLSSSLALALADIVPEELGKIKISIEETEKDFEGSPLWNALLNHYKIDIIIHEACNFFTGEISPLILKLMKDDEWSLIYLDGNVLIFLRNKPEYENILEKFRKPKELVFTEIIMEASSLARLRAPYSGSYASLAFALIVQDRIEEAKKMADASLALNKKDIVANLSNAYIALKENKMKKEKSRDP